MTSQGARASRAANNKYLVALECRSKCQSPTETSAGTGHNIYREPLAENNEGGI